MGQDDKEGKTKGKKRKKKRRTKRRTRRTQGEGSAEVKRGGEYKRRVGGWGWARSRPADDK